jgi:NADPH-dependent glutamate synthase beta subunit-like oxidoreductase
VVEAQIREILDAGDVTLKLNSAAGRDFTVSGLRQQGFDAVVLAVGAHRSRDLSIPGVDLDGVHKGIEFLLNANLGYRFSIGQKVVVIGGGNVAMDVARSAVREVLKQHRGEVEGATPSEENVAAVATREMVDVSLSALRMGSRASVCMTGEVPSASLAAAARSWGWRPSERSGCSTRKESSIPRLRSTANRPSNATR